MRLAAVVVLVACSKDAAPPPPPPPPSPAPAAPALSLAVTVDGRPATWGQDVFDRTPHFAATNNSGASRDAWSLRELARTAGPTARVVAVLGASKLAIEPAAWADASKIPIVHRTRRGALKFRWTDAAGTWSEAELKDVTGLELVTPGEP